MKPFLGIFFLFMMFSACQKNENSTDSAMRTLDIAIADKAPVANEMRVLDSLKKMLKTPKKAVETYAIQQKIIDRYMWFRADSAFHYVHKNREIASKLNNRHMLLQSQLNLSILLSTAGLLNESSQILETIDKEELDSSLLRDYYYAHERFYYVSSEFNHDNYYTPIYKQKENRYKDSVRTTYPYGSLEYNKYTANLLVNDQKYVAAKDLLLQTIPLIKKPSRFAAMVYFDLAEIYEVLGNNKKYVYYLTLASIVDRKVPTKENAAIKELAFYLYKNKPGQLDRANRYIQIALEDASFYNNRQRIIQISEKLPLIVNAFQKMREQENNKLKSALIAISILLLIILVSLYFLYRKMMQLRTARTQSKQLYEELQVTNAAILQMNDKLSHANETREEYLGVFMDLCASYISKLDDYKHMVRHKVINNKAHEILKNLHSQQFATSDRDEFTDSFDRTVLHLFPNFIEEVNQLLKESHRIVPKKGMLLTTELRILALIRLGIDSSQKIASFLHYSPQTIYNYKVKLRSYSQGSRNDFEENIKHIKVS